MIKFRPINRLLNLLLPPSIQDWLSKRHLARFVVDIVESLDLSELEQSYRGSGSLPYHPKVLLALLIYCYATGRFSSRKIEEATHDSLAVRFITGNEHPDHDTINSFRQRCGDRLKGYFVDVLRLAREMGMSRFGEVSLDGTKLHANASRHSAMSYAYAEKLEAKLKEEVDELLRLADEANRDAKPAGLDLPKELSLREERLKAIAEAKARIEARAQERFACEQAAYEEKMAARKAKEKATGKKIGGRKPAAPTLGPRVDDQTNFTDEASRIMPLAGGGFEQCYNSQAVVDHESMLVMVPFVTQAPNDKEQVQPAVERLQDLPEELRPHTMTADNGYFSEKNVADCHAAGIEPLLAPGREPHHPHWSERHSESSPLPDDPASTPVEKMKHRLKTREGRALYARRKQTVEPVFGIIKSVMGFRQFSVRGLKKVQNEWTLVCLAWNFKRMAVLRP